MIKIYVTVNEGQGQYNSHVMHAHIWGSNLVKFDVDVFNSFWGIACDGRTHTHTHTHTRTRASSCTLKFVKSLTTSQTKSVTQPDKNSQLCPLIPCRSLQSVASTFCHFSLNSNSWPWCRWLVYLKVDIKSIGQDHSGKIQLHLRWIFRCCCDLEIWLRAPKTGMTTGLDIIARGK